jgi:hypothetical protein
MRGLLIAALLVALLAACQAEEEAPSASPEPTADAEATPTPSPPVEGTLWRWVNVTVLIPEGSDMYVIRLHQGQSVWSEAPVLTLALGYAGDGSSVTIDAETGAVVREDVRPKDRLQFDLILKTLEVSRLDRLSAPWPYNGDASETSAGERIGRYVLPELRPELGLQLWRFDAGPHDGVLVSNGKSDLRIYIDDQGELEVDFARVVNEDRAVFERLVGALRPCYDAQC